MLSIEKFEKEFKFIFRNFWTDEITYSESFDKETIKEIIKDLKKIIQ